MSEPAAVDVLVVGAGSSGSVLAARLSDDPDRSVLLVDEGPDLGPDDYPERVRRVATVPSPVADAGWTRWFETGVVGERVQSIPRGRVVGGSSAVNGAYFIRGTAADFDGWAELGNPAWSFEQVLPAFRRIEDDLDLGDDRWHGAGGPMPVRRASAVAAHPVTTAFVDAALAAGYGRELDKNAPGPPGVGMVPCNAVDGVRVNAAMAWLDPARDRPNLTVHGGVRVRRVVIEHGRAIGVEVDAGRTSRILRAGEVVLSAGAIGSAQLLLASGVGPADDLLANGVEVLVDAPGVGRLWDHPGIDVYWTPVPGLVGPSAASGTAFEAALHPDVDLELLAMVQPYGRANGDAPDDPRLSLRVGVQRVSRPGRVQLSAATPHAPPVVQLGHLSHPDDLARARRGARLAVDLLDTAPLRDLVDGYDGPAADVLASDSALDSWLLANVGTAMHSSGTCAMGPDDDASAVVDQHGRVRGVEGLRVADTSIMPTITSRGPAATALMIGERMAELFDR